MFPLFHTAHSSPVVAVISAGKLRATATNAQAKASIISTSPFPPESSGAPHSARRARLSDADGQRHRQEDKCQDKQAAHRSPDPSFHSRVHAGVAAAKQRGVCCISFQWHELRLITLSDVASN